MNEDMKKSDDMKNKKIIISLLLGLSPVFLIFFTLFVSVFLVLGLFSFDSEASGGGYASSGSSSETGSFTISRTLLSKNEFKTQLSAAVSKYPKLEIFAENADNIYDIASSENVNPELVVVRAIKEGFSPGSDYNYWGIGCTNTGEGKDCRKYSTFNDGVRGFVNNVSRYASLYDMMSKYAYIGDYWYNPGSSSVGGCYYATYIYETIPGRVQDACASYKVCSTNNTDDCVATTEEDQVAYATWQVNGMLELRDSIFDVKVPDNEYDGSGTSSSSIMSMSDTEAWFALTGYYSSNEANTYATKSDMESRMVYISVPIRVWNSADADDYSTKKSMVKLRVNRELASLYTNFFNELYEETGSEDNLFVVNPSEIGCYNYRKNTSGTRLSAHSYGVACDLNWSTVGNRYNDHVYTKSEWINLDKSKSKYYIIYKGSKVVEIAHKYTLSWGGEWRSVTDAMHFSFIGDETRATLQSKY